jgi:hypothetical protein
VRELIFKNQQKISERHPERERRILCLSQNSKGKTQKLIAFDF